MLNIVFSIFAVLSLAVSPLQSLAVLNYETGAIGCLYNKNLCELAEVCQDDALFGICKDPPEKKFPPISITVEQAIDLEQILSLLVAYEYPWTSPYVQCILRHYMTQIQVSKKPPDFPEECNKEEKLRRLNERIQNDVSEYGVAAEVYDERSVIKGANSRSPTEKYLYEAVNDLDEKKIENIENNILKGSSVDKEALPNTQVSVNFPQAGPNDKNHSNRYEMELLQLSSLPPEPAVTIGNFHFYKPSTRAFYKSFYSIPDPPPVFSKEAVRTDVLEKSHLHRSRQKYFVTMYILCGFIVMATFLAVVLYFVKRRAKFQEKFLKWVNKGRGESSGDYQNLFRHHRQSNISEKTMDSPLTPPLGCHNSGIQSENSFYSPTTHRSNRPVRTPSTNSSSSSWTEEPCPTSLDVSTGHLILSYMEEHLKDKERLKNEWDELTNNDPEPCSIVAAIEPANMRKNRCTDIMPYEHTRVRLNPSNNVSGSEYINANYIIDNDPRNPTYIITQGPLPHTVADFWQMVWEQNSVVIVNLTRLNENSTPNCHRYWPEEGSELYHIYEVQLISEHVLSEDFVVRNLVAKCLQTSETRTVTQFHLTSWPSLSVPPTTKVILDFRRKVNKSYRSKVSPIVVHCGDGAGRSGTYCLIDMTLNRLKKGAKEINIAAGLEHLRDQRINLIRTKDQFEYALTAIADEVRNSLNTR